MNRGTSVSFTRKRGQKGIFAPLTAIVLLVLFAFFGVAIDSGRLYIYQGDMQRSADMGVLGGADILKFQQQTQVDYAYPRQVDNGINLANGPLNTTPAVCTALTDKVLEDAAINGVPVFDGINPCTQDGSYCYGQYYSDGLSIDPTTLGGSLTTSQYDVIFYNYPFIASNGQFVSPGSCSGTDFYTNSSSQQVTRNTDQTTLVGGIQIEVLSPPRSSDVVSGSDCSVYPDNCVEVIMSEVEQNYVMSAFGQSRTVIKVESIGYGL